MPVPDVGKVKESRITESYLVNQINGFRNQTTHTQHKAAIQAYDDLYGGNFAKLFPGETGLSEQPLVENKLKNASHDLARLANEAKGAAVFMKEGESQAAKTRAKVRASIAQTIWKMGRGDRKEAKLYLDLISTGYAALSVFHNENSEYPQFVRLNPRFCYPDVMNGELQTLLYCEAMKERQAARIWPDLNLNKDPKKDNEVLITMYFDSEYAITAVCNLKNGRDAMSTVTQAHVVSSWEHKLDRIPIAFVALDSADDSFHGLFDQLGGPMMVRNKAVRLMTDYLESMAHAPFEEKGVINNTDEPGPLTVYHHDPNAPESFMRRVAPAAPAGSVFGLMQYMESQESAEAIQPPARVGIVSQSIASGSFVASTQGTLSSVVKELQEFMADLRYQAGCIAFKVDERYLDHSKPLYQAVGGKTTYTPSTDMGGYHYHTIQYGAAAGLNRSEADVRILQHLGAQLISHETARAQIEYLDDVTVEDDRINRENLESAAFQRFATDPNTPQSILWKVLIAMDTGITFVKALQEVQPEMFAAEQAAQAPAPTSDMNAGPGAGMAPADQQKAMESGATGGPGLKAGPLSFAPKPLPQIITRNAVQ